MPSSPFHLQTTDIPFRILHNMLREGQPTSKSSFASLLCVAFEDVVFTWHPRFMYAA